MNSRYKPTTDYVPEELTISIRLSLPDYNKWKTTMFIRQYPYLTIVTAGLGILALILLLGGLGFLWHVTLGQH
ncbi:MAG TPA: hypothetical protein VFW90_03670 [Candidatus Saccharimonadales bacterium]|nr:hypothetical protein [Candidatus Saccharimonadales bacterium]